jgi:ankyrin repeat protein
LFNAVKTNNFYEVISLIESDLYLRFQLNEFKKTILHCAIDRKLVKMTQLLIHLGCDLNAKDLKGRTPLFYALRAEFRQIAAILIANFSTCFCTDTDGTDMYSVSPCVEGRKLLNKGKFF